MEPNRNTLWGKVFVDELVKNGVTEFCVSPGSRSTPLTYALAQHPEVRIYSHLDERCAAFFALGRSKVTGVPTPVVSTSGTAAANFHPAVIEADESRVPMLILTSDRPPELQDSGANQTVDQEKMYGDSVRWYRDMPEPEAEPRKMRSLRVTAARAVFESIKSPSGPVHLNFPFRKPLEPTEVEGDIPDDFDAHQLASEGRQDSFVRTMEGVSTVPEEKIREIAELVRDSRRGLIVAGPMNPYSYSSNSPHSHQLGSELVEQVSRFSDVTGFPIVADPLSGLRFGEHLKETTVLGGYDSYFDALGSLGMDDPEIVLRFGASPTSKVLRHYLRDIDAPQILIDEAGEWREATFTATHLVESDPGKFFEGLKEVHSNGTNQGGLASELESIESRYWELVDVDEYFEGGILREVAELTRPESTIFVSNSMPVRDLDRFGAPKESEITVLGNRGASGIDGITSSALGAGMESENLVLVTGDIAYYHDMNGLLAIERCGVDATIVVVNNDGGGIFHVLPIEDFDPPFTQHFKTPHGLDFEPTSEIYNFDFVRVSDMESFRREYESSLESEGTQVIEARFDAEKSHRFREELHEKVCKELREEFG